MVLRSFQQALPIILGYIPLAIAYGMMAHGADLSFFVTILMSLIVFAGSAQYIAVGFFASGYAPLLITSVIFIVNLRHFLFSTSISRFTMKWSRLQRLVFASELTDETFAVHFNHFQSNEADPKQAILCNIFAQSSWILGSVLGFFAGEVIPNLESFGFDFALPAMFIGILALIIKKKLMVLVGVVCAILSLVFAVYTDNSAAIIVVTILGATLGLVLELWKKKKYS